MRRLQQLGVGLGTLGLALGAGAPLTAGAASAAHGGTAAVSISGSCTAATVTYSWQGFAVPHGDAVMAIVGFDSTDGGAPVGVAIPGVHTHHGTATYTFKLGGAGYDWFGSAFLYDSTTNATLAGSAADTASSQPQLYC